MTPRLTKRAESSDILGPLIGALAIVISSAALGMVVNHVSPRGIPIFPKPGGQEPYLPPGVLSLTVEQAYTDFEAKSAVFLDARSAEEYEEAHIPGSLNLPLEGFEERFLDHVDEIEAASKVIVICQGIECSDSIQVAERLLEAVQGPIHVVEDGWRAWERAGYPVEAGWAP